MTLAALLAVAGSLALAGQAAPQPPAKAGDAKPAAAPAAAAVPAKPAAAPAPVQSSTAAAYVPVSPATIYTADKLRDPFVEGGLSSGPSHPFSLDEFSIHNLTLRALMRDRRSDFALFTDNAYGNSLILKNGRLHDPKGKPIPHVTGKLDVRRKTATLQTEDQDVQVYRLGEEGEE